MDLRNGKFFNPFIFLWEGKSVSMECSLELMVSIKVGFLHEMLFGEKFRLSDDCKGEDNS